MKKHKHILLYFLVSFVFVTLFSRSTSFLYVFEGADPSVFKQMGRALLNGKILYVDYFDNKGCLLYFIHALGLWLGGDSFLMLFQVVSLFATLIIWDKILGLYQKGRSKMICLAVALMMLLGFYGAGDQTQEWCLPFISWPLWVFCRSIKEKTHIKPFNMFLVGLCFGIITFIQVNNACAFLGFVAYCWIQCLLKKEFRQLLRYIGCFVAGWVLVVIPCVLYFYVKAGWFGVYEMAYASFLSNLEYMGHQWRTRLTLIVPYCLFLISIIAFVVLDFKKNKNLHLSILLSLCFFLGSFGKLCNAFYLMAILPLCVTCMITLDFDDKKVVKYGFASVIVVCLAFYLSNPLLHLTNDLILQKEQERVIYKDFHHCLENVPEEDRDSIFNYNLYWHGTSMMQHEGLLQCNRVLFTSLVFNLPSLWKEETTKKSTPPKWIILSFDKYFEKQDAYFILENYENRCSFHYNKRIINNSNIGDAFDVYLFQRKD